jgi:hypothetical protein
VQLASWLVHITEDVGHACLVAHEARQVHGLGGVIPGEGLDPTTAAPAALLGQEAQGTAPRVCRQQTCDSQPIGTCSERALSAGQTILGQLLLSSCPAAAVRET